MDSKKLDITILYVEDDRDTREQLSDVFKYKARILYVTRDGQEALEIFKEHKIHLIVSDYQMPKINGNELCKAVKEINPNVNFILLTAYNDKNLLINAIDAGVDKFLSKPINAKQLFNILDEVNNKIMDKFQLERSNVCLKEAEKIALLSYWDVNLDSKRISFSQEAEELFDLKKENKNTDYKIFSKNIVKEDRDKFLEIFEKLVFEEESINDVVLINTRREKYIHIVAKRWRSSACGTHHIIGLFQDVSHYERKMIQLLKESQSDPMLNISNKKLIMMELENLIKSSQRYGHSLGVLFFDIDDFKHINDTYGHIIADEILVELSKLIQNHIRQSDLFGRWGGDEFIIITGYSSQEATILLAKKIINKVQTHTWSYNVKLTVTIGISFYEQGDDPYSLISKADTKMYESKKLGKNNYSY